MREHPTHCGAATRSRRRGGALVYIVLALPVMAAFTSLAVDVGHAQLVKTQLRAAADAAARYGAYGLSYSTTYSRAWAVLAAGDNSADGSTVVVDPTNDVDLGTWSSTLRTFTVLTGNNQQYANAVRVTTRRTAAGSNAVPLTFAGVVGMSTVDVTAKAIATWAPGGYGVVGLNSITMSGNSSDSYWSTTGSSTSNHGAIASNGPITLTGGAKVSGDAHPGIGYAVSNPSAVTGSSTPLTTTLSYPAESAGWYQWFNSNGNVPSSYMSGYSFSLGSNKTLTLPGGYYYFNNFSMGAGANLYFSGQTTVYVYGSVSLGGHSTTSSNVPGQLRIVTVANGSTPPGSVTISVSSGASLYADVYAPLSDVSLSGNGDIYGSLVGKTVSMSGSAAIHYDLALGGFGSVQLVQ